MIEAQQSYSIAVFPFLRSGEPIKLGDFEFRSTSDLKGLTEEQATSVREVAAMLFLRDDLRIQSSLYAICPYIDMTYKPSDIPALSDAQAVVAYLYGTPGPVHDSQFQSSEYSAMVVFSHADVPPSLVRPDRNVEPTQDRPALSADGLKGVPGYSVLYNFRHLFWVAAGSQIHSPIPGLSLNVDQDLHRDVETGRLRHPERVVPVLRLLESPRTPTTARALTAIRWFNNANSEANSDDLSLVSLAIAFESLLGLPQTEKADRLVDSISLLLGRVPRLDTWAHQFYEARSSIVHEGRSQRVEFVATDSIKKGEGPLYQPLLSYGLRIFRLCLSTLLFGDRLAQDAGLEERFITNQERFQKACAVLNDSTVAAAERLGQLEPLVDAMERYMFVWEGSLKIESMLAAMRLAVQTLLENDVASRGTTLLLQSALAQLGETDVARQLEAVDALHNGLPNTPVGCDEPSVGTVGKMASVVSHYTFMYFFWLKRERASETAGDDV
ncbi:MAG: HEPN domain-containing protein [Coriobacteriia bacterium]|nr:HEPN domain-containing protein [Coriobacteriia bacterium]